MPTKQERLDALDRQVSRLQRRLKILDRRSDHYSWVRLAIFLCGIILTILAFFLLGWLWALPLAAITVIVFSVVASFHRRVDRSITRHKIWQQITSTHIARIRLDWQNIPPFNQEAPPADHPFATDLDISGERSLHRLVNTAVSSEGSHRLYEWLLHTTPDMQTIARRQELMQELAPLTRFRNTLLMKSLLASSRATEHLEGKRLQNWLHQQTPASPKALRTTFIVSAILSVLAIVLLLCNLLALLPPQYWILAFIISIGWFYAKRNERGDLFEDAFFLRDAFAQLSSVFEFLETYPYGKHERLKKLCEPFFANREQRPSTLLKRISRIASAATLEKNQLFWLVVNALVPWDVYVALRLSHYKALLATLLPSWLDTWFELEALNSLATFAYLNPEYTLPQILPGEGIHKISLFQASGLGHPLITAEQKVVNDFTMSAEIQIVNAAIPSPPERVAASFAQTICKENEKGEVVIITGSNMSGKSTFLRTLGINLCLAYAGAPVNARALQTSLFRIYTCIKVSDSVTDGYSYFYAEVKRLKALLTELERESPFPLFFLIDEIFKGTNNRERLIGSRAYIQALVGKNCMGAISTHDLELVKLADALPEIQNYHFKEEVIDGQMVFDYILRPGPCPTTNALKIMQLEGLPVFV